ncbi:MAG: glpK [Subtercola sp.]|nr:glpK [Subtercola sp.]
MPEAGSRATEVTPPTVPTVRTVPTAPTANVEAGRDVVIAIDQGTSSTKAIALDSAGRVIATASVPLEQSHPAPGWVEQDARQLLASVHQALADIGSALAAAAASASDQSESAEGVRGSDHGAGERDHRAGGQDHGVGGQDHGAGGQDHGVGGQDHGAGEQDHGVGGQDHGAGEQGARAQALGHREVASVSGETRPAGDRVTAGDRVAALALSNQRESALIWSTVTGEPLGPVLGWQDRRTIAAAQQIAAAGFGDRVREITGLPLDPMFSALKFAWLLDEVDPDRSRSRAGEIALGTVDTFLLFALTGEHRIELGNASRTQLLDLATLDWSAELLSIFRIPREALPRIAASNEPSAPVRGVDALPPDTRFHAVLGDSHAALFGHGTREPGAVKVTLGTGSSIMGLLPSSLPVGHGTPAPQAVSVVPPLAPAGLVTTVAWGAPDARLAFEGNILSSGSTVTWLAGLFGIAPADVFALAATTPLTPDAGVDLVPAFAGLGAPWWDESARAVITGFDLGAGRDQLARAAVESIVLQVEDVLSAAEANRGRFDTIVIDGGPAANDELAQLLADLTQRRVERPSVAGLSALGAAHLAGIAAGVFTDDEVLAFDRGSTTFVPHVSAAHAAARRARWLDAVGLARSSGAREPSIREPGTSEPSTSEPNAREPGASALSPDEPATGIPVAPELAPRASVARAPHDPTPGPHADSDPAVSHHPFPMKESTP